MQLEDKANENIHMGNMNIIEHHTTIDSRNIEMQINDTTFFEHTECDIDEKKLIKININNRNLIDIDTA